MPIQVYGFRELRFNSSLHRKGDASGFHFRAPSGCIGLRRRPKFGGQWQEGGEVRLLVQLPAPPRLAARSSPAPLCARRPLRRAEAGTFFSSLPQGGN